MQDVVSRIPSGSSQQLAAGADAAAALTGLLASLERQVPSLAVGNGALRGLPTLNS